MPQVPGVLDPGAATRVPCVVRAREAGIPARPGHPSTAGGDGEAPNHHSGGAGARHADAVPGARIARSRRPGRPTTQRARKPTPADAVQAVVAGYETKESPEAVRARDADQLECMIQGIEYRAQGYAHAQRWIDNGRGRILTKSAQALADAVLETGSLARLRAALGETS
ncbi:HAD family hydrolase [Streptomyces hirsutus]|uniref:HAD family hydrolase n=1 Tax=Streptomyces hirsutus TaxID=35620 RepID=UPI003649777D